MLPSSDDPEFPEKPSRRAVLKALAGVSLWGTVGGLLPGCSALKTINEWSGLAGDGLWALAGAKGRQYGAAVQSGQLDDWLFTAALKREAGMLVPENELKWDAVHPAPNKYDFTGYKKLAEFAKQNRMSMRGHVLVWHHSNPLWLAPALANKKKAQKILEAHISRVVDETSPFIRCWDVVNEAVFPKSKREDGLRETIWLKALGPEYIEIAFRAAHQTNPDLMLVYNDYGTEREGNEGRSKRQCILRMLDQNLRKKVPIHCFGLQSHLQAHRPFATSEFKSFLKEVRAQGLKVIITELDLDVSHLSGPMEDRIAAAQNYVSDYLDMVQDSGDVETLLTWGLSDRYTWLRETQPNIAGALPLNADMNRGPLWNTLKESWLGYASEPSTASASPKAQISLHSTFSSLF